jgi:hypothetical protein
MHRVDTGYNGTEEVEQIPFPSSTYKSTFTPKTTFSDVHLDGKTHPKSYFLATGSDRDVSHNLSTASFVP